MIDATRRRSLAVATATALTGSSFAQAAPAGPTPRPVLEAMPHPRLTGQAALRHFLLRIYDIRLWAMAGSEAELLEHDLFLEVHYALSVKGARIAERSVDEMRHIGRGSDTERARWGERMKALFPDMVAGDRLLGHHVPRSATHFFYNERPIGAVEDPTFGPAFFGIWFDPRTSEPALRTELLRGLRR